MKRVLKKVLAGCVLIGILQVPAGNLMQGHDHLLREQLDRVVREHPEILLLGDSTFRSVAVSEAQSRDLMTLMRDGLPGRSLGFIQGPGFGPELYRDSVGYLLRKGYRPRAVVLCINLRCFSEFWDQMPQFQFSGERLRLRVGDVLALSVDRPLSTYHVYSAIEGYPRSEREYDQIVVRRGSRTLGTLGQLYKSKSAAVRPGALFDATYLYDLSEGHRKLRAFDELASDCRKHGVFLSAYATPIDLETGTRESGTDLHPTVERNLAAVRKSLGLEPRAWLDAAALLPSADFDWDRYPNEHLRSHGRKRLAGEVTGWLQATLK